MIGIIHLRLRISLDVGALLTISLSHEIFGCWVAKKNVRMYGYGSIRNACTQERIIRSDWRKVSTEFVDVAAQDSPTTTNMP